MTTIGMIVFSQMQLLDFIAPYDVFTNAPDIDVAILAPTTDRIDGWRGVSIEPTAAFADAPHSDVIFVPGGLGISEAMEDRRYIDFIAERGRSARYVTSVCTGSLVLGAAGLLNGYRATTHWRYVDLLEHFGAHYSRGRVVHDRNRITAGGVTAGLDFGLELVALLKGTVVAETLQLALEYDPAPPYRGHPATARDEIVELAREHTRPLYEARKALVERLVVRR